ncbi:MAG: phosphotransferase [Planctomycetota bacterium]
MSLQTAARRSLLHPMQGRSLRGAQRRVLARAFADEPAAARRVRLLGDLRDGQTADETLSMADPRRPHLPEAKDVFRRLRWGGQAVLATPDAAMAFDAARGLKAHGGFVVESGPNTVRVGPGGVPLPLPIPGLGKAWHVIVARKVTLIAPREQTDRFTFDVKLVREPSVSHGYVVLKTVPTYRRVVDRLRDRFPEANDRVLLQRADKLVKRVFPVFLTRETAFLQLLQRDLPPKYRSRVPEALAIEKAPDGTVRKLFMSWLKMSGEPMSHLDFAEQSAELLQELHDTAGVIHLDLRLDNMVISNGRVCFVDFGSAVRTGEDLDKSPLLKSLFHEMMQTSEIQRTLGKMKDAGHLTSDALVAAHGRVDRGVDLFYLALQISRPYWNPDLVPFIDYDETSGPTRRLKKLTDAILRPSDRSRPDFISAQDVLNGVRKIRGLAGPK